MRMPEPPLHSLATTARYSHPVLRSSFPPLATRAQRAPETEPHRVSAARPPARPTQRGPARSSEPPKPRKKAKQTTRPGARRVLHGASPVWLRRPVRGASISPTESEGIAVGDDEDEAGEVRSEGSGPQSWRRAPGAVAAPGAKRTQIPASPEPTKKETVTHRHGLFATATATTNTATANFNCELQLLTATTSQQLRLLFQQLLLLLQPPLHAENTGLRP